MANTKPYKIEVPEQMLQRLKQKLALTDFPEEIEDAGWAYGTPLLVLYVPQNAFLGEPLIIIQERYQRPNQILDRDVRLARHRSRT
jgi:hypothetical protein